MKPVVSTADAIALPMIRIFHSTPASCFLPVDDATVVLARTDGNLSSYGDAGVIRQRVRLLACFRHSMRGMADKSLGERLALLETSMGGKTLEEHFREHAELIDRRFAEVHARFAEIYARFTAQDKRFDGIDARLTAIDRRFDAFDARFSAIDRRFDAFESRFVAIDSGFSAIEARVSSIDAQFVAVHAHFDVMDERFNRVDNDMGFIRADLGLILKKLTS